MKQYETDLQTLTDDAFEAQYKATKRQYRLIQKALPLLSELAEALSESGPLEIDQEMVTNTECLIEDYYTLLQQMEMAAEWDAQQA